MKTLKKIMLGLAVLLSTFSCKKEKLTKETQTGANTFSCKINGKVYVAKSDLFSPAFYGGFYRRENNIKELSLAAAVRNSDNAYSVTLKIPNITGIGIYKLEDINLCKIEPLPYTIDGKKYSTKNLGEGIINITYVDYDKNIISGTFSFTAVNLKDSNDQISITDGRFDIQTN